MSLRFEQDLQRMLNHVPPGGIIVDARYGRGQYSDAFLSRGFTVYAFCDALVPPNPTVEGMSFTAMTTPIDQTLLPHRTIQAVWATDRLFGLEPILVRQYLSLFVDWLVPGGCISFHLPEGEGKKRIQVQGAAGRTDTTLYLFEPNAIEQIVQSLGLRTLDAWREGPLERQTIHLIVQKP